MISGLIYIYTLVYTLGITDFKVLCAGYMLSNLVI